MNTLTSTTVTGLNIEGVSKMNKTELRSVLAKRFQVTLSPADFKATNKATLEIMIANEEAKAIAIAVATPIISKNYENLSHEDTSTDEMESLGFEEMTDKDKAYIEIMDLYTHGCICATFNMTCNTLVSKDSKKVDCSVTRKLDDGEPELWFEKEYKKGFLKVESIEFTGWSYAVGVSCLLYPTGEYTVERLAVNTNKEEVISMNKTEVLAKLEKLVTEPVLNIKEEVKMDVVKDVVKDVVVKENIIPIYVLNVYTSNVYKIVTIKKVLEEEIVVLANRADVLMGNGKTTQVKSSVIAEGKVYKIVTVQQVKEIVAKNNANVIAKKETYAKNLEKKAMTKAEVKLAAKESAIAGNVVRIDSNGLSYSIYNKETKTWTRA